MSRVESEVKNDLDVDAAISVMEDALYEPDPDDRVIVQVYLPHVTDYNPTFDPMRDLVYRWTGSERLDVGDLVLCPPTPKRRSTFTGIVVSLRGQDHPYKGACKALIGKVES